MTTFPHSDTRHENADRTPVAIERSDAIDAAGALVHLAGVKRREATSRSNAGPDNASHRAWLRAGADVYDAAAYRIQNAADFMGVPVLPPVGNDHTVVHTMFLMMSFRYALGRMTYAVGMVADTLEANVDRLSRDWREQIIRDIGDAIEEGRAGMSGDVERWTRCAEAMAAANAPQNT